MHSREIRLLDWLLHFRWVPFLLNRLKTLETAAIYLDVVLGECQGVFSSTKLCRQGIHRVESSLRLSDYHVLFHSVPHDTLFIAGWLLRLVLVEIWKNFPIGCRWSCLHDHVRCATRRLPHWMPIIEMTKLCFIVFLSIILCWRNWGKLLNTDHPCSGGW